MSSLRFGQGQSQTSIQQDSLFSINLNDDPETPVAVERIDEPDSGHIQTSPQRVYNNDVEAQQEEVETVFQW